MTANSFFFSDSAISVCYPWIGCFRCVAFKFLFAFANVFGELFPALEMASVSLCNGFDWLVTANVIYVGCVYYLSEDL